jgi:hypothetical protein
MLMKSLSSGSPLLPSNPQALLAPSSPDHHCPVHRIAAFLCGFVAGTENCSHPSKDFLHSAVSNISSLSTPNGPWVYTIVPWED